MLIDTHCHLDASEFSADRDEVVQSARAVGVSEFFIPSVTPDNFPAVRQCCTRYPGCFPAYGIHPLYLEQVGEADLERLRNCLAKELAGQHPPVAVGEIGLDFYVPGFDAARQEYFFIEQLRVARDFDLPVILHIRRAVDSILKGLRRMGIRKGIAHAFNGSQQQADEFLRLGFKLGFGGAMTHPGSTRIRRLASTLPLEAIVLETDAPDIPPAWLDGARNTPGELGRIVEVFSELRGISRSEAEEATSSNAHSLFAQPLP